MALWLEFRPVHQEVADLIPWQGHVQVGWLVGWAWSGLEHVQEATD